ncbi:MAG: hypothetical protein KC619_32480 [Myxococcales bacterium]|nr:hypothetical protein [Myxococcales bacterium]
MGRWIGVVVLSSFLLMCGSDEEDTPPPPSPAADPAPADSVVTVTATSVPPGAAVTGGGRPLGTTPLTTQVPIPAPEPGQPPATFAFDFALAGYQPTTIQATPLNGVISLSVALAPDPSASAATAPATPAPDGVTGTWVGRVRQRGYDPYPITMTIDRAQGSGVCGRVEYRTFRCGGELHCEGPRGRDISFREVLTQRATCVDRGRIEVHRQGESLAWQWYYPNGRPGARATLSRAR